MSEWFERTDEQEEIFHMVEARYDSVVIEIDHDYVTELDKAHEILEEALDACKLMIEATGLYGVGNIYCLPGNYISFTVTNQFFGYNIIQNFCRNLQKLVNQIEGVSK